MGEGRVAVWVWHVRVLSLRVAGVNDLVDNGAVASRDIGLRARSFTAAMTCALQSNNEQKRKAAESNEYIKYAIKTYK